LFTTVAWTGGRVLPHWAAPGYLMLFPLLGVEVAKAIEGGRPQVRTWLIGSAASLAVVLASVAALAGMPWPLLSLASPHVSEHPLVESFDWTDLESELSARGLLSLPNLAIITTRWHEAGKIDYALHGQMPVFCLSWDPRGYGVLTRPEMHLGMDALIIGRNLSHDRVIGTYFRYFETLQCMAPITIRHAGKPAFELSVFLGHRLRSPTARPSLLDPLSLRHI
jgi:hypothetical protein